MKAGEGLASADSSARVLVHDALRKNLFSSASVLAEILISDGCQQSDYILYAKTFFCGGEPRRCLAILEKMNFLSASLIDAIAFEINPELSDKQLNVPRKEITLDLKVHLEAIRLAAQCLFAINQYEDCLTLLVPLVSLEEDDSELKLIIKRLQGL